MGKTLSLKSHRGLASSYQSSGNSAKDKSADSKKAKSSKKCNQHGMKEHFEKDFNAE
ncbi:MAG: hypothetical protein IT524_06865 [Nitrosomonas sp.]|nr:hypothetical protein [Nitrosomonas sp.]